MAQQALTSAPPPIHSVALIGVFFAVCFALLPTTTTTNEEQSGTDISVETFCIRIFPSMLSIEQLGYIRAMIAILIYGTVFHMACISKGWVQATQYLPGSRLIICEKKLSGGRTLLPYTSISWIVLGIAFTLSSYIALTAAPYVQTSIDEETGIERMTVVVDDEDPFVLQRLVPPALLRCTIWLWEIAAPSALLVSAVIKYAIWPGILKHNGVTTELKSIRNMLMHNVNSFVVLVEAILLSGLPVRWTDIAVSPILGLFYVLLSWAMMHRWNDPDKGPQFLYFFLDTTLGAKSTIALAVLMAVLLVFYSLFASLQTVLELVGGGSLVQRILLVGVLSLSVMRFRD